MGPTPMHVVADRVLVRRKRVRRRDEPTSNVDPSDRLPISGIRPTNRRRPAAYPPAVTKPKPARGGKTTNKKFIRRRGRDGRSSMSK